MSSIKRTFASMNVDILQIKQRFGIIGKSAALEQAISVAAQVAPTDMSVLVMGESGVGKEFFPQIIHHYSLRKHNAYIAVNCGAIPEGTIDSELFGHRKGSFTGALSDRKGYFEEADGGTIFLDEVGELPLATQARLLRVLENGEFIPVGASKAQKTNVRVVAATNVDVREAVRRGKFREDLYFRLNMVSIHVPPLRERSEDIVLLFRMFAAQSAERYRMPQLELMDDARSLLKEYTWPGNIRELRNVAEQISVLENDRKITSEILSRYIKPGDVKDLHPVVLSPSASTLEDRSFASEREILYQILFDMRRDITELRQAVAELSQGKGTPPAMYHNMPATATVPHSHTLETSSNASLVAPFVSRSPMRESIEEHRLVETTDAVEELKNELINPEEPISIEEAEKRLILAAINRNKGNRKQAAEELRISERTLYRRLKEYGIED